MFFFFFFNDTATTEIYTLSLHDALPILPLRAKGRIIGTVIVADRQGRQFSDAEAALLQSFADQAALALENARLYEERSEEHTSELQSQSNLVCRLLLEQKKRLHNDDSHQ